MHIQVFLPLGKVIMVGTLVVSPKIEAHVCDLIILRIIVLNSLKIVYAREELFILLR